MANNVRRPKAPFLPPKNNRLISVGQRNLEALQHNNRANVQNAVSATGYPVTLYNTLRTGVKCSCQFVKQKPTEILGQDGKLSEQDMSALLTPTVGVRAYGANSSPEQFMETETLTNRVVINDTGWEVDLKPDTEFDRMIEDWQADDEVNELNEELTPERFIATRGRACGICFGTGYIGGYELIHGTRIILCAADKHERNGATMLDGVSSPNAFQGSPDGWVRFTIVIPRGVEYALYPRVFNNTKTIPYRKWKLTDLFGNELEPEQLKELATGKPVQVELRFSDAMEFTHVELVFSGRPLDQPIKADSPEIQTMTDVTRMDAKSPVTFILGGTHNISKRAVVIDHLPRLGRHWRVNDIQERRDNLNWIYEQTLTSRVIDLYEITQLLRPVRYERAPLD